jgi:adenylylsulfate kinase
MRSGAGQARSERLWLRRVVDPQSKHIRWQSGGVTRAERERVRGQRAVLLWLTGLSGSGKSTLAQALERVFYERGLSAYVLDGDNIRYGLSGDLGFSPADRAENIRRIGEVAKLFVDAGVILLCAFVSPYRADRDRLRAAMASGDFVEIHVFASLATCRTRDPKGLYQKAAAGEIADLTGVGSPYEPPEHPELVLDTERQELSESVAHVLGFLEQGGYIRKAGATDPA